MKKVLGVAAVLFLLVGCGSGKETTTVCKGEITGEVEIENEIIATGDKVTKTIETATKDFASLNPTDEELKQMGELVGTTYSNIEGITFDYKIEGKALIYTVVIDYDKADLEELKEKNLITLDKDQKVKYISLKVSTEGFEKQGLTCKEK